MIQPAPRTHADAALHEQCGAYADPSGCTFVVAAPRATAVDLCLLDSPNTPASEERRIGMHPHRRGLWSVRVEGIRPGQRYAYRAHGPWDPNSGSLYNPRKRLLDPYAKAIDGRYRLGPSLYAHEVDDDLNPVSWPLPLSRLDSAGDTAVGVVVGEGFAVVPSPRIPRSERVIYEIHVRGFTQQLPGVPERLRGTYAGLAHPATIAHLKSLGVTTIELLPIQAAMSEPFLTLQGKSNYWGYSTLNYFAPEPSYATEDARRAGPQAVLDEVRGMVSLLHEAGLEVVMDVVYNHTCEGGMTGPSLSLRGLDDLEYYLHAPVWPTRYDDVTGCGNTVDFRSMRALRLCLDSLRYWAQDMGVDGFRFDLAATLGRRAFEFDHHHPLLVAMALDPVLSTKLLISEPWDVGPDGWHTGDFPEPFHDWNDRYRGTVRSFWLADAAALSKGRSGSDLRDVATRLSGSADLFGHGDYPGGRGPLASVNFITAHDGFTMRDLTCFDHKHNLANGEENRDGTDDNRSWNHGCEGDVPEGLDAGPIELLRQRSARNLMTTLLLSAGTPMILGGDEWGRSQQGNNNAYCQDNELTWCHWQWEPWQKDLCSCVSALIRMRREHPVMRPESFADGSASADDSIPDLSWYRSDGEMMDAGSWHNPQVRVVQMLRSGAPVGDVDMLVVINGSLDHVTVTLPDAHQRDWHVAWDSTWMVPRSHTDAFALAHRHSQAGGDDPQPRLVRDPDGTVRPCRHDRPGDVTAMESLSIRVYFSGEALVQPEQH